MTCFKKKVCLLFYYSWACGSVRTILRANVQNYPSLFWTFAKTFGYFLFSLQYFYNNHEVGFAPTSCLQGARRKTNAQVQLWNGVGSVYQTRPAIVWTVAGQIQACGVGTKVLCGICGIHNLQGSQGVFEMLTHFCLPENVICHKCHNTCQLTWDVFKRHDILQCCPKPTNWDL